MGVVYRPPDSSIDFFKNLTNDLLNFENLELIILGDFNINLFKINKDSLNTNQKHYLETIALFGIKQLIIHTRLTSKTATLIDHVLTNHIDNVTFSGVVNSAISDHNMIYCIRKTSKTKFFKHKSVKLRSLKNYSKLKFCQLLKDCDFSFEDCNNANTLFTLFNGKFLCVLNKIAPFVEKRIKNTNKPWFDKEVCEAIKARDKVCLKVCLKVVSCQTNFYIINQEIWLLKLREKK